MHQVLVGRVRRQIVLSRGVHTLVGRVPLAIDRRAPHRLDLEDVDDEGWLLASARRRSAAGDVCMSSVPPACSQAIIQR